MEEVECGEVSDEASGGGENALGRSDSSPPTKVEGAADEEVALGAGAVPAVEPAPSVAPLPLCS